MLAGLLVNVLLIGLPVLIVGLVAGWIARVHYGDLRIDPAACIRDKAGKTVCHYALDVPGVVWAIVAALTLLAFACAIVGVIWRPRHDSWRVAIETWEVRFFLLGLAAAVVLVLVPWLAAKALALGDVSVHGAAARSGVAAFSSVAALFAAALGHVRGRVRDEQKALAGATKRLGKYAKAARDALIAGVVMLAGPLMLVAICVLGVLVAVITGPADATNTFAAGPLGDLTPGFTAWFVLSVLLLAALWLLVDLTSVSLHPFYRRQLATAFALKRVWIDENGHERAVPPASERGQGRVVARQRSFDKIVELTKSGVEPGCCAIKSWPMLVICAAANVSDPGATPPGRAVASFTFSPTAIGGPVTAAAPTDFYEHDLGRNRRRDVTLPAAVAMSGAALAPSMGKLTYRPITFLLGLANIRLGVWVPNPAHINARHRDNEDKRSAPSVPANDRDVRQRTSDLSPRALSPRSKPVAQRSSLLHRPRPQYLWKEVFGRNRLEDKFLYVTDGATTRTSGSSSCSGAGAGRSTASTPAADRRTVSSRMR